MPSKTVIGGPKCKLNYLCPVCASALTTMRDLPNGQWVTTPHLLCERAGPSRELRIRRGTCPLTPGSKQVTA